jgi:hypothetical protein
MTNLMIGILLTCMNGNQIHSLPSSPDNNAKYIEYHISHQPTLDYLMERKVIGREDLNRDGHFHLMLANNNGRDGTTVFRAYDPNFQAFASADSLQYVQFSRKGYGHPVANLDICY